MQVELGPVPAAWQRHPSMDPRPTLRPSLPFTAPLQVEARGACWSLFICYLFRFLLPSLTLFYHHVFFVPRPVLIFCFLFLLDLEAVVSLCHSWCLDKLFVLVSVRELWNWDLTVCRRRHQMKLLGTEICDKLGMTLSRLNKVVNVFQFQRSPCKQCFFYLKQLITWPPSQRASIYSDPTLQPFQTHQILKYITQVRKQSP